jgi:hypothetical protein
MVAFGRFVRRDQAAPCDYPSSSLDHRCRPLGTVEIGSTSAMEPENDVHVRVRPRERAEGSGRPPWLVPILVAVVGLAGTAASAILISRANDKVAAANRSGAREASDLAELRRVVDRGALQLEQAISATVDLRDRCQEAIDQKVIAVNPTKGHAPEFGRWQRAAERLRERLVPLRLTEVQLDVRLGVQSSESQSFAAANDALLDGAAECRHGKGVKVTRNAAKRADQGIQRAAAKRDSYLLAARSRVGSQVPVEQERQ